jgi:hypothetical protein
MCGKKYDFGNFDKKAISPVVAIALLLVTSVVAVVGFQGWFENFQSQINVDVETQSKDATEGTLKIEALVGSTLYVINNIEANLSVDEFKIDGEICVWDNLTLGMNEIDVEDCLESLTTSSPYVVLIAGGKLVEKRFGNVEIPPKTCLLDGQSVIEGTSFDFYNTKNVSYGSTCPSSSRTCNGETGVLGGDSSYNISSCSILPLVPNLTELDSYTSGTLNAAASVYVVGSCAYVASSNADSLTILNISDPSNIVELDSYTSGNLNAAGSVYVQGDYAYVVSTFGTSRLTTLNISDPSNIVELDSYTSVNLSWSSNVYVSGSYAYVASTFADSLTTLDISDPNNIIELDSHTNTTLDGAEGVYVVGNYAYVTANVANSLTILDVGNSNNIVELDSYTSANLTGVRSVYAIGNYVYVVASAPTNRLTILDVSNPNSIIELDSYTDAALDGAIGVYVAGNYAYVTSWTANRVIMLDVSNSSNIIQLDSYTSGTLNNAKGVYVVGDYIYVASYTSDSLTTLRVY